MMDDHTGFAFLSSVITGPISDYDDIKTGLLRGCHSTNQGSGTVGTGTPLFSAIFGSLPFQAAGPTGLGHGGAFTKNLNALKPGILDNKLHYDFTNISDDGRTFFRGGSIYNRPCGWKRYALKVDGKFTDDIWLDGKRRRSDIYSSAEGEWPVSYHGTSLNNGLSIGEEGYKLSKRKRDLYGEGIYSTPDIDVAVQYAGKIPFNGNTYLFVVQNRVNPKNVKKVDKAETGVGEYWISPTDDDIRPYGFCVKKI